MHKATYLFVLIFSATFMTAGCHSQVPPTPQPSAVVTWPAASCPSGQTCNYTYIVSSAVCTSATACPTPGNSTYTPLNQSAPVAGLTYTDSAPSAGNYVAYVVQAVLNGATGQPSVSSVPILIALYPGKPGQPTVTSTAMLAPSLDLNKNVAQELASNNLPTVGQPTVNIQWSR